MKAKKRESQNEIDEPVESVKRVKDTSAHLLEESVFGTGVDVLALVDDEGSGFVKASKTKRKEKDVEPLGSTEEEASMRFLEESLLGKRPDVMDLGGSDDDESLLVWKQTEGKELAVQPLGSTYVENEASTDAIGPDVLALVGLDDKDESLFTNGSKTKKGRGVKHKKKALRHEIGADVLALIGSDQEDPVRSPNKQRKGNVKPLGSKPQTHMDEASRSLLEERVLGTGSNVLDLLESDDDDDSEEESAKEKTRGITARVSGKKPAWIDEGDDLSFSQIVEIQGRKCETGVNGQQAYQTIVEGKYQSVMGAPKWAKKKADASELILSQSGSFVKQSSALGSNQIELKKMKDLNQQTRSEGPIIKAIKFHPKSTVALVAGVSGIVSLLQVDGKENAKLQSIQFEQYPINCASFLNDAEEFLIGSQHYKYFYSHNMITGQSLKVNNSKIVDITNTKNFVVSPDNKVIALCGKFGHIYLLSPRSKEYIGSLKMNGDVSALSFSENGTQLYSHGADGEVYIWDMRTRDCVSKFIDDGCLGGTSISVSNNNLMVACGSSSGIVNLYDGNDAISNKGCRPIKIIDNLITQVNCVQFNPMTEILAISSSNKDNAVKLVHCASRTVFSNFPSFQSKLKRPQCVEFSPNSGFFAIGDNNGSAHLFRLKYYGNY